MIQEIGSVLGPRATARIATSALPGAPAPKDHPMHPMFVKLFLEDSADDVLAEEEDRRRTATRARRSRSRRAITLTTRDRDRRAAR